MTTNEKINSLKIGSKISYSGKVYEVKFLQLIAAKINRVRLSILEVGQPETYTKNGIGIAVGKVFEFSNIRALEVSTYKTENNWDLIN